MIQNLSIKNFKTLKHVSLSCSKLNVFIGEPNSGKSNLLEAIALKSQNGISSNGLNHDLFRYKNIGDLFFDFDINNQIEVKADDVLTTLRYDVREDGTPRNQFEFLLDAGSDNDPVTISHGGEAHSSGFPATTNVRYYEFKTLTEFRLEYLPHLSVPYGENLASLLLSNKELKKWVSDFLKSKGLTLNLKPTENDLLVSKIVEDEIFSYPFLSLSETLQRIIFYSVALKSNSNSILLFDEPESNTFPFYTKELAERIALDNTNQFFITTHNPYLLLSLIEKTPSDLIRVFLARMEDYQTMIHPLSEKQIEEVLDLDADVFFNFERVLGL